MTHVLVLGGGIAGLCAAWEAVCDGAQVTLVESTDHLGGKLRSAQIAGHTVDVGAESMLGRRPESKQLIEELELDVVAPARVAGAIWSRGEMHPIPRGTLMGVPADPADLAGLLTADEVARAQEEQIVRIGDDADISVGDLVERALGPAVVDRLVEPLLGGVYAGNSRRISAEAAVRPLVDAARAGRSVREAAAAASPTARTATTADTIPVFASLRGGIGTLPGLLADALKGQGVEIELGTPVVTLAKEEGEWAATLADGERIAADRVVVAVPAAPAAKLLGIVSPDAAGELKEIEYASSVVLTYAFDRAQLPVLPQQSGFLVPPPEGRKVKAATFSSIKWPWLAETHPDVFFARTSVGRYGEVAQLQRSDDDLLADGLEELRNALGELPDPIDSHAQRWGGGLPQYAVGHVAKVRRIREALAPDPTIAVAGAAYDGVGIPACIGSGRAAARAVLNDH